MVEILEANSRDPTSQSKAFVVTNLTEDLTLDCNQNDDLKTADNLGTLIRELQRLGIIKGTSA